jgi:hypothetical protein
VSAVTVDWFGNLLCQVVQQGSRVFTVQAYDMLRLRKHLPLWYCHSVLAPAQGPSEHAEYAGQPASMPWNSEKTSRHPTQSVRPEVTLAWAPDTLAACACCCTVLQQNTAANSKSVNGAS